MRSSILIYGATGRAGTRIAQQAIKQNIRPILAGRDKAKLALLGHELGLEYRVASLDDFPALDRMVRDVDVVLNCAGPFVHTAIPLLDCCLRARAHYLDITGEITVFEALAQRNKEAQDAGIMILPGIGFSITPSDSLAVLLKKQLPDARKLTLVIGKTGSFTRGAALTVIEHWPQGGMVRQSGQLVRVPHFWKTRSITHNGAVVQAATMPWGDVSTAFYSTNIPNIEVFVTLTPQIIRLLPVLRIAALLPKVGFIRHIITAYIQRQKPTAAPDDARQSWIWGEVESESARCRARLYGPSSATFAVYTAVAALERMSCGDCRIGFQTPGHLWPDMVFQLPGVSVEFDATPQEAKALSLV